MSLSIVYFISASSVLRTPLVTKCIFNVFEWKAYHSPKVWFSFMPHFKIYFYWSIVVYNVVFVSIIQWISFTYTYISPPPFFFWIFFPLGHHRALSRVPCATQSVLIIHFIHGINSVYWSIPVSQFIPPSFPCSAPPCHFLYMPCPFPRMAHLSVTRC